MSNTAIAVFFGFAISATATSASTFTPSSVYLKNPPPTLKTEPSNWSGAVHYGVSSDYADDRRPRAYTHVVAGETAYKLNPNWDVEFSANLRAETVNGQIPKGQEQSYSETLHPSTELAGSYHDTVYSQDYSINLHGEPLWDEDARREGHTALIGAGADVKVGLFDRRFAMIHSLDGTSLLNSYEYGSDLVANPDYFVTYKWKNELRIVETWKVFYTFGAKVTRYLDGFLGYSYNNTMGVSGSWGGFNSALTYDNGGFTDDGYVRLWYIDQYRRVARLMLSYAF